MIQEPCASDGRLAWVSESAEQAVNTPNDEERLEQMSHPKNKVMERMTPPKKWNGLAWVCTKGYGKVLLDVVPQTQRVRLVRLSLFG